MHYSHIIATVAISLALATPLARASEPAAPWPESAQSRPLPRPAWVLVIPARRLPSGALSIWDPNDPWAKAWRTPATVDGLRLAPLFGDDEDKRNVTAEAIDGMLIESLEVVMRKYGAPAFALAVTDGHSVALAGWAPGWPASWEPMNVSGNELETKKQALSILASMFKRNVAPRPPQTQKKGEGEVQIEEVRQNSDANAEYSVILHPPAGGSIQNARAKLESSTHLHIVTAEPYADGLRLVVDTGAGDIEPELRTLGFSVR